MKQTLGRWRCVRERTYSSSSGLPASIEKPPPPNATIWAGPTMTEWFPQRAACGMDRRSDPRRPQEGGVSAALPPGLALLGEGGRALLGVLGAEDRVDRRRLPGPELLLGPVADLLQDLLRRGQRKRRVRADGRGELQRDAVRHALRDAQQSARAGDEATLDLRDAESRALGRDEQVAGQGDLEAARDREALHGRDERLARGALRDAREAAIVDVGPLSLDERTEIHARGEALAGAGED